MAVCAGLLGCAGGDYDAFRAAYVERATYGDEFRDPPPELTDAQIDAAMERVCVDGEPDLDEADEIGESLAGGLKGSTGLGSAIYNAVEAVGC